MSEYERGLFEIAHDATIRKFDERLLIQALLTSTLRGKHDDLLTMVEPHHFYTPAYGQVWDLARRIRAENSYLLPPNFRKAHAKWGEIPIEAVLTEVAGNPVSSFGEAKRAAEIVKDYALRRKMVEQVQRSFQIILDQGGVGGYTEALDALHSGLQDLDQGTGGIEAVTWDDGQKSFWQRQDNPEALNVTPTPWPSLNEMLPAGGLSPGQLFIFGARPGVGKSLALGQTALHAAMLGKKVLLVSMEMSEEEIQDRMVSCGAEVNFKNITDHTLEDWQRARITEWEENVAGMDLEKISKGRVSLEEIYSFVRAKKRAGGLDILIVDYIQKAKLPKRNNLNEAIGEFCMGLKAMAMDEGIVIITAAQLNRGSQTDPGKEPTLEHLRSSGDIENEANVVVLMHRDTADRECMDIRLIVGKNRGGRTGALDLFFDGAKQQIRDL
ncbi:replicative DNA helicase [Tsukamurella paurometabola]|uniref:AAA family ATPase n=1 Tax=Tsukamurella paurometabola TaxID=2061 RepID=A0ABS5NDS1_TSUPA|nr:DnaB-like helicase C-terminal domain-containing protein [Tsukamurella paurometabola]MBS4102425.1 AAA family ATPase [Tsukamurella paurometabola]